MAKKTVNWPGQFKLGGRERPGKDIPAALVKEQFAEQRAKQRRARGPQAAPKGSKGGRASATGQRTKRGR